jgi:hypothetical protein
LSSYFLVEILPVLDLFLIVDPSSAVLEKKSKNQFNDIEELCDDSKDIGKRVAVS